MGETDETHRDLIATLEACGHRLNGIQKEAGLAGALIEIAVATLRQSAATASLDERLEAMLERHHERIVASVLQRVQSRDGGSSGTYPFRMDPISRAARIGRRRIPLTESEFKVLERLWEEMPSPVSRAALLDRLYGPKHEHSDTVIDMFILRIRQKLKNAGCTDAAIVAVRGLGWLLDLRAGGEAEPEPVDEQDQTTTLD